MAILEIPLRPSTAQRFSITLAKSGYRMQFVWNTSAQCWVMDLLDSFGNNVVTGIAIVTGADLFAQFGHLNLGGQLIVQTDHDPDAIPTFANLGVNGHVYYST